LRGVTGERCLYCTAVITELMFIKKKEQEREKKQINNECASDEWYQSIVSERQDSHNERMAARK